MPLFSRSRCQPNFLCKHMQPSLRPHFAHIKQKRSSVQVCFALEAAVVSKPCGFQRENLLCCHIQARCLVSMEAIQNNTGIWMTYRIASFASQSTTMDSVTLGPSDQIPWQCISRMTTLRRHQRTLESKQYAGTTLETYSRTRICCGHECV